MDELFWHETIKLLQSPQFTCWDVVDVVVWELGNHSTDWSFVTLLLFNLRDLFVCLCVFLMFWYNCVCVCLSDVSACFLLCLLKTHPYVYSLSCRPRTMSSFTVLGDGSRFPPDGQPGTEPDQWKVPMEALLLVTESRRPQEWAVRHPATLRANNNDVYTSQVHNTRFKAKATGKIYLHFSTACLLYIYNISPHWKTQAWKSPNGKPNQIRSYTTASLEIHRLSSDDHVASLGNNQYFRGSTVANEYLGENFLFLVLFILNSSRGKLRQVQT